MVKVIQIDDDGSEIAAIEMDDFTIEIVYAGIAAMLQNAAAGATLSAAAQEPSRGTRERRARILKRVQS